MQLSSTAPVHPNTLLWDGTLYVKDVDFPRGLHTDNRVYRGERIGAESGYSSLGDAVRAAKFLSGDRRDGGLGSTAIAIVRDGARFDTFLTQQRQQNADGSWHKVGPLELGQEAWYRDVARTERAHAALVGFVDGEHVDWIRAPKS